MTRFVTRRRWWSPAAVALLVSSVALFAGPALPAGAASTARAGDPAGQRDQVRQKKAEVAAQVDTLNASSDQVNAALDALDANVRGAQAEANDAQRAADSARAAADEAQHEADAAQATIDQLRQQVAVAAIDAYVHPPADQALDVLQQESATKAATKSALLSATSGAKLDVVDEYRAAKQQLEVKRDAASEAQQRAASRADELAGKAASFQQARAQQASVASQVDQRINEKLAESDALSTLDKTLSKQIAAEQAALVAKVQKAAVAAPTSSGSGGSGSGASSGGGGGGGGGGTPVVVSHGALTTVGGITVASSIAGQVSALLKAASAAGFNLGGGGYRDPSSQIALRKAHCGTSDYAIYQMPASQCHPPTAPPGSSMHEQGLAIDFTNNGKLLARGDAAFAWMQGNAGSFGLRNLPSEPWHWSTNGN